MRKKTLFTVEEFKELQRRADPFAPQYDLRESAQMIIIGFDPHASRPGVAVYDAARGEVLKFETVPRRRLTSWLDQLKVELRGDWSRLMARVEVPTRQTVYGKIERMKKAAGNKVHTRKFQMQIFSMIWASSKGETVADDFGEDLKIRGVPVEFVPSDNRISYESNKAMKGKSPSELEVFFRQRALSGSKGLRIYPSKLTAQAVSHFFAVNKGGNKESRDALCLCFPELLAKKI